MSSARTGGQLRLVGIAALAAAFFCAVLTTSAEAFEYVINISCDALRSDAITRWVDKINPSTGDSYLPNFKRLRTEGAFTDNARTDYNYTCTSPDHVDVLTGRPVKNWTDSSGTLHEGHQWGDNVENPWARYGLTFHDAHIAGAKYNRRVLTKSSPSKTSYEYVSSVFDVAHDAGLRTGLYAGKSRFKMYQNSYDAAHSDNGVNKIDDSLVEQVNRANLNSQQLVDRWKSQMDSDNPLNYSFLHFADPDEQGHRSSWNVTRNTSSYMQAVEDCDRWLGQIFSEVENDERLNGNTAIVLTADHGGTMYGHSNARLWQDYTVPLYVWGQGVAAGADLYDLNPQYKDPGKTRVTQEASLQPIRNGCSANLCLSLLGLESIPGSTFDYDQSLNVFDTSATSSALRSLSLSANVSTIPEPSAIVLLLFGAACLAIATLLARISHRARKTRERVLA